MSKEQTNNTQEAPITAENAKERLLQEKDFKTLLNSMVSSLGKSRELVHQACMQALIFAAIHENYDRASQVLKAVAENFNQRTANQVRMWFEAYGPFAYRKTDDKNFPDGKKFRKSGSEDANPFDISAAYSTPFWKIEGLSQDEVNEAIKMLELSSVKTSLTRLLNRLETAIKDGAVSDEDKDEAQAIVSDVSNVIKAHFGEDGDKKQGDDNAGEAPKTGEDAEPQSRAA